ncbi:MAG: DUF4445 domain-containing protein [Spirochaetales bacterium]|nr:DUF4445 domain-containing protein [Spirochaetales bacterium]
MKITLTVSGRDMIAEIKQGESLLDAVNKAGISGFDAPCGGKGSCGKCRIAISPIGPTMPIGAKPGSEPDDVERDLLSEAELGSGIRLACRVYPEGDMSITVPDSGSTAVIQTSFSGDFHQRIKDDCSPLKKTFLELAPPSIDDQRPDFKRLSDALSESGIMAAADLVMLRRLPDLLREHDYKVTVLSLSGRLCGLEGGDTVSDSRAVAVDIGTTTVVAYLVDLAGPGRGRVIDLVSALNEQKGRGGDVISRIEYCMRQPGNLDELGSRIRTQISGMVAELCSRNNISISSIGMLTIAGNSTMTHIFSGFNPLGIAFAPFIPVHSGLYSGSGTSFGLQAGEMCSCMVLPGISAYVGSDITAGIIASEMHKSDELSLLIDIGTNGEIVLGSSRGLSACSTAAGPALEGANISCGMGGVEGAVNSITVSERGEHEVFSLSVIGGGKPEGICGSGIVDALAVFLGAGVIDETGRIRTEAELTEDGISRGWIECLSESGGKPALKVSADIMITQMDIREIQMAKAAIAAGIRTLLSETGRATTDIKRVFVAGGFGAAMNKASAAAIGLFPSDLEPVVEIAGNTAGKGAILAALSARVLDEMVKVSEDVEYIELSTSLKFQQEYMNEMYFRQ